MSARVTARAGQALIAGLGTNNATILSEVTHKQRWLARYDSFWRSMPWSSHALFLGAVFAIFLSPGLLTDIPLLGANSPLRLAFSTLLSGALAVAYVVVIRERRRWVSLLIVSPYRDHELRPTGRPGRPTAYG